VIVDKTEAICIPATHFGRRRVRWVSEDSHVRLEVRLPAPMVRELTILANARGASIARVVTDELGHLVSDDGKHGAGEEN
jgi:hypothetical protein